jgi:hypothetical protein
MDPRPRMWTVIAFLGGDHSEVRIISRRIRVEQIDISELPRFSRNTIGAPDA